MKEFDLGDVLSITTGRLLSLRGMNGIYAVLNYLTQDDLFTHQLPRAHEHCKPFVLKQHPDLVGIEVPQLDRDAYPTWLDEQKTIYGETRKLVPVSGWKHINAIDEAVELVGKERVIVVEIGD